MRARVRFLYVACCVLWGSTWLAIKLGLRDLPPLRFAAARMLLAAAVLLPFAARAGLRRLGARAAGRMAAIGVLQIGAPYALLFVAQQWVPSGLSAVLFATFPVWLLLFARVLLPDQPLRPRALLAAALGLGGIAVLQLPALRGQALSPAAGLGAGLIVAAAMLIAVANLITRRTLSDQPALLVTCVQILGGAALLCCAALGEGGRAAAWTPRALAAVAYLAIFGTALTYLSLFWLLPRLPVSAIGAIPLVDTTVAVLLGTAVLGEPAGWPLVAGGALVLAGAALAGASQPTPQPPPPEAG